MGGFIKQVPGGESLANTAPTAAALASQAFSLAASHLPYGGCTQTTDAYTHSDCEMVFTHPNSNLSF